MKVKYLVSVVAVGFILAGCSSKKHGMHTAKASSTEAAASVSKMECTNKKDVRVLEVVKKDHGCSFDYTKFGKTASAASSAFGTKHCEDAKAKAQGNLEKAGFSCK